MRVTDCCWLKQEKHHGTIWYQMCAKPTGADNFGECRTWKNLTTGKIYFWKCLKKCEKMYFWKSFIQRSWPRVAADVESFGCRQLLQPEFLAKFKPFFHILWSYIQGKINVFGWQFAILCFSYLIFFLAKNSKRSFTLSKCFTWMHAWKKKNQFTINTLELGLCLLLCYHRYLVRFWIHFKNVPPTYLIKNVNFSFLF